MEKLCEICKKELLEGEETVTCPDCGKMYHKACWDTNGVCTSDECRAKTAVEAEEITQKTVENDETPKCLKCGQPVGENQKFCPQCGTPTDCFLKAETEKVKNPLRKKMWIFLATAAVIVILIVALGVSKSDSSDEQEYKENEEITAGQIDDFDYEYEEEYTTEETTTEATTEATTTEPQIPVIKKGEKKTVEDICEFYVDYTNITKDVLPQNPDSVYTHYEADAGKTYVDICIAYKNLESTAVGADDVGSVVMIYDDNYEYSAFSMIEEDSRGDFTYSNITNIDPLAKEYIHYLIEVPDEVVKSGKSIVAFFSVNDENFYRINIK